MNERQSLTPNHHTTMPVMMGVANKIESAKEREFDPDWIAELRILCDTLPLDNKQYELLTKRLHNSEIYATSEEYAAARFELRHVVGTLKNSFGLADLLRIWLAHEQNRNQEEK